MENMKIFKKITAHQEFGKVENLMREQEEERTDKVTKYGGAIQSYSFYDDSNIQDSIVGSLKINKRSLKIMKMRTYREKEKSAAKVESSLFLTGNSRIFDNHHTKITPLFICLSFESRRISKIKTEIKKVRVYVFYGEKHLEILENRVVNAAKNYSIYQRNRWFLV